MLFIKDMFDRLKESLLLESLVAIFAEGELCDHVHLYSLFNTAFTDKERYAPPACWASLDRTLSENAFRDVKESPDQPNLHPIEPCLLFGQTWQSRWQSRADLAADESFQAIQKMFLMFIPPMTEQFDITCGNAVQPNDPLLLRFLRFVTDIGVLSSRVYTFLFEKLLETPFLGSPVHVMSLRYLARHFHVPKNIASGWYHIFSRRQDW
jgi:hypothetical protein